jgi:Toxin SymE, type I toxin-antitoxin system
MTMDVPQSTTQHSEPVKPKHIRRLQVGYLAGAARKHPPQIRISGRWVEEAGFPVGTHVNVEVSPSRIVIEPIHPEEYPVSPPKRAYISERMAMMIDQRYARKENGSARGGHAS